MLSKFSFPLQPLIFINKAVGLFIILLHPLTQKFQINLEAKHRGFAFVTYSSTSDAQDAIDNMDLNELRGHVIKVNLARSMKTPMQLGGNRPGK